MELDEKYNPDELKNCRHSSYIINDYGFTLVSNGRSPFFAVFPEPEEGYGETPSGTEKKHAEFLNAFLHPKPCAPLFIFIKTPAAIYLNGMRL